MNDENKKAQQLLNAIGEIDDQLIFEAQTYRVPLARDRVRRLPHIKYGALAACLVILIVIAIALPLIGRFNGLNSTQPDPDTVALDSYMMELKGGNYRKYSSFEELSYVGNAEIVWQYEEGGEIYSKPLTSYQLSRIENGMGRGEAVEGESPELNCRVWILDGLGNVKTPYLKDSAGNTSCRVFDYEAEIIPDESVVKCISDIMN